MKKTNRAFSLIELSIVILIIGVLIAATGQGIELLADAKLSAARQMTQSSRVDSIKDLALWHETTMESSFLAAEMEDGKAISVWNDNDPQTGSRNNATQATQAAKPIYTASAINSLPALLFSGTKFMDNLPRQILPTTATGFTVFTVSVSKQTAVNKGQDIYRSDGVFLTGSFTNASSAKTVACVRFVYTAASRWLPGWYAAGTPYVASGSPMLCSMRFDASLPAGSKNFYGWTNGGGQDSGSVISGGFNSLINAPKQARIGNNFVGYIGEIIVFGRALSQKEVDTVEAYLGKKWNIKLN